MVLMGCSAGKGTITTFAQDTGSQGVETKDTGDQPIGDSAEYDSATSDTGTSHHDSGWGEVDTGGTGTGDSGAFDTSSGTTTWYIDADGDGYGSNQYTIDSDSQPSGFVDNDDDCDDTTATANPAADEICDGIDNDCDGQTDDDASLDAAIWHLDYDGDGYGSTSVILTRCDQPSGYVSNDEDCDDTNANTYPGAEEVCDGEDNDCDGTVDGMSATDVLTWYTDADGDGYGDPDDTTAACDEPSGSVSNDEDCDDTEGDVNPDAEEVCDEVDNDCDGDVDDDDDAVGDTTTWYGDSDGDGYGDEDETFEACETPYGTVAESDEGFDCDDGDDDVYPGADEVCDEVDNDCDGEIDEDDAIDADTWYVDADEDGYGLDDYSTIACDQPSGWVDQGGDCDDGDEEIHPDGIEVCDDQDNDCDGDIDDEDDDATDPETWYADVDDDGFGDEDDSIEACELPYGMVAEDAAGFDCDDNDDEVHPDAEEICDEVDNDCDGDIDDDDNDAIDPTSWYADVDGDGYGNSSYTHESCEMPSGYAAEGEDCDDDDEDIYPDAEDIWYDGVDSDCEENNDYDADEDGAESYEEAGGTDCNDSDDDVEECGCSEETASTSCLTILECDSSVSDGTYWIDPDGTDAFEVECDMTTDGGGWTQISYASDFEFDNYWQDGDTCRWLDEDFALDLTDDQILAIQAVSTEGFQEYIGLCNGVLHYYYDARETDGYALGFAFIDGTEVEYGGASYEEYGITVTQDGCSVNGGEGGEIDEATIFEISSIFVPVVNVYTCDNGDDGEEFGSPLTDQPAYLR